MKSCLLSLLAIQVLQNALALQRSELFQLAESELTVLPEADDIAGEIILSPPFAFYGTTYEDYFVSCSYVASYYNNSSYRTSTWRLS